jgi:hypothetical protein
MFPLTKRLKRTEQAMLFTNPTLKTPAKHRFAMVALLGRTCGNDNRCKGFAAGSCHKLMTIGQEMKQRGA